MKGREQMAKKINCKHGLEPKEEIEARRLKDKLIRKDKETIAEVKETFKKWVTSGEDIPFIMFLKGSNKVMASAIVRACQEQDNFFESIVLY